MWSKIRELLNSIPGILKAFAKQIIAILALLVALVSGSVYLVNKDDKASTPAQPEVAQVFEPSISTPLPADVNSEAMEDQTEAKTENESISQEKVESAKTESENDTEATNPENFTTALRKFIAPTAGVDPSKPIDYSNTKYGFSITLPPQTQVIEKDNLVLFENNNKNLLAVNIVESQDNIETIAQQLKLSPNVNNITLVNTATNPALMFTNKGLASAATIYSGKIYYLSGDPQYFSSLKF